MLLLPDVWGRDPEPKMKPLSTLEEAARRVVAEEQNRLATGINWLLSRRNATVERLAEALGMGSHDQLWRKLAGRVPATRADLVVWAWLIGGDPKNKELPTIESVLGNSGRHVRDELVSELGKWKPSRSKR